MIEKVLGDRRRAADRHPVVTFEDNIELCALTDKDIRTWASSVVDGYGARFDLLKKSRRPTTTKGEAAAWSKLALVMTKAVKAGKPRLPPCAEATAKILGIDTPSMSALNRWLDGVRQVPKRVPLEAPGDPKAKHGNLRYIYEMVPVAQLIRLKLNTSAKSTTRRSASCPTTSRR
jgi:hypothetical protein